LFSFPQISCHKLLLSLFVFSFLTGCASTSEQQGNPALPQWVQEPPADNLQSIYAIGEGFNLDSAKQNHKQSLHNEEYDQVFQQKINTQIKDIELTQTDLLKTEHSAGQYYVLMSLSLPEFIADKRGKLDSIINSIKVELPNVEQQRDLAEYLASDIAVPLELTNIEQKNKVEQLYSFNKIVLLVEQAKPLLDLLSGVDKDFDSPKYKTLFTYYIEYEKQLLANTYFYINSDRQLNKIGSSINDTLQTYGFQTANKANSDGIIDITGEVRRAKIFSTKTVIIDLKMQIKSKSGHSYKTNQYKFKAASVRNYESAKKNAIQQFIRQFTNQIKNKSDIYSLFGVNGKS